MTEGEFRACRMPFWHLLFDMSDGEQSQERIDEILHEDFVRTAIDDANRGGTRQTLAIVKWESEFSDSHIEDLKKCYIPALVCHGIQDPLIPFECGRELATLLPNSTFLEFTGGHNLGSVANQVFIADKVAEHVFAANIPL